jgi:hypothetical protein
MHEQLDLPFPPPQPSFAALVRPVTTPPVAGLVPLEVAKAGDLSALRSSYHANLECNETPRGQLDAFYLMGQTGSEAVLYDDLEGPARAIAAQIALDRLFLAPCIHGDVLKLGVVREPLFYDLYVFTYATLRILLDARALTETSLLFEDLEECKDASVYPCVIEISEPMPQLLRTITAERYLQHALSLLPEGPRPARGTFHVVHG